MNSKLLLLLIIFSLNKKITQEGNFIFRDKGKMVELVFESNQSHLEMEKSTQLKVLVENIDLKNSSIVGAGIRMMGQSGKNYFICEVTAHEKYLIDNNLEISIYTRIKDENTLIHKFLIPVKR